MEASATSTPAGGAEPLSGGPVLEFRNVTLVPEAKDHLVMRGVNLRLQRGGLALVLSEDPHGALTLGDAAEGLIEPDSGTVLFRGEDWATASPGRAASLRGRIGRVFDGTGWVSNLDVLENVTISERHHTRRPVADIVEEAQQLARSFAMGGVPEGRPVWVARADLRRAEWVRALLGAPALLILEQPTAGVSREHAERLVSAVRGARERGAAVLWTTSEAEVWKHLQFADADRYAVRGESLVPAGETVA